MPVQYTVTEVQGIFDLGNKVRGLIMTHGITLSHDVCACWLDLSITLPESYRHPFGQQSSHGASDKPWAPRLTLNAEVVRELNQHRLRSIARSAQTLVFHVRALQALLRGVAPGSFPCALGPEPEATTGLRRFVVIDENIHRLYGQKIRKVRASRTIWLLSVCL